MTPDNELPIWPFQPNWREAITERLVWATGVLQSDTGAEQAFSTRLSPRREFEALFNPFNDERTFFDLFVSELGGQEMMIPLWHDRHKLTAAITDGDTRVDCDTEFGEFMDGGMALLIGADAWSHQAVEIDEVDADGFTLAVAADFDWPEGALILPLRRSRIDINVSISNLTSTVGQSTIRFVLNQANDLPDNGEWDGLMLDGYPVLTIPTNWVEPVNIDFSRIMETEDNGTGIAFIRDIAERAFRAKNHFWQLRGRGQNWEFRQFLYRLAGRRTPLWVPTGASDMVVAATANAAANNVQVRRVGLTYVGGPQPGRDRFLAETPDGYQARRITGMGAPALPTYERINLNADLTYALPAGTRLSFLEVMRADGDSVELKHHTDTEGMTECSINFRGFSDTRNPAGSNFLPLPSAAENQFACGEPAAGTSPCLAPPFEGWEWEWVWITQRQDGPHPGAGTIFSVLNTPDPYSLVSNDGQIFPFGPKFSMEYIVDGAFLYQRMKMVAMPLNGEYEVIIDPNNLYPPTRYSFAGRPWTDNNLFEYWTADGGGFFPGGFARSGTFDFTGGV